MAARPAAVVALWLSVRSSTALESRPLVDGRGFLRDVYPVLDYVESQELETTASSSSSADGTAQQMKSVVRARTRCYMRGRQVPGDGACLFHALSAGLWLSMNGTHHPMDRKPLREQSMLLRQRAVDVLEDTRDPWLYMGDSERLRASKLLALAAEQCGQSPKDYCYKLRKPHAWGGGPEIVALSNAMRRPIHVYELLWAVADPTAAEADVDEEDDLDTEEAVRAQRRRSPRWCLKCIAEFGSPRFERKTPPLHILSCDSRFPNLSPEQMLEQGNHFLLLFDCEPDEAVHAARDAGAPDDAVDAVRVQAERRALKRDAYRKHLRSSMLDLDEYFTTHNNKAVVFCRNAATLLAAPVLLLCALKKVPHFFNGHNHDDDVLDSTPSAWATHPQPAAVAASPRLAHANCAFLRLGSRLRARGSRRLDHPF